MVLQNMWLVIAWQWQVGLKSLTMAQLQYALYQFHTLISVITPVLFLVWKDKKSTVTGLLEGQEWHMARWWICLVISHWCSTPGTPWRAAVEMLSCATLIQSRVCELVSKMTKETTLQQQHYHKLTGYSKSILAAQIAAIKYNWWINKRIIIKCLKTRVIK